MSYFYDYILLQSIKDSFHPSFCMNNIHMAFLFFKSLEFPFLF